jgi:hypothetical protein
MISLNRFPQRSANYNPQAQSKDWAYFFGGMFHVEHAKIVIILKKSCNFHTNKLNCKPNGYAVSIVPSILFPT